MTLLRFVLVGVLVYIVVAVPTAIIVNGPFVALLLPFLIPYEGVRRAFGASDIRLQRLLNHLASRHAADQPHIVETRVFPGLVPKSLDGYLVCEFDRDIPQLREGLPAFLAAIAEQARDTRPLGRAVSLVAVSRETIRREYGWFGYRRNVTSSSEARHPNSGRPI